MKKTIFLLRYWILASSLSLVLLILVHSKSKTLSYFSSDRLTEPSEKEAFETVYQKKLWGNGSGIGSEPENAGPYLQLLQSYLDDPRVETIIDLGCGDWKLMTRLKIPTNKYYVGYDLVESIIEQNKTSYGKKNIQFVILNQLSDFKDVKGDLLLVKDVLHHWPNHQINYFLKNILPNFQIALITNDFNLYSSNPDIVYAGFRTINLQKAPYLQSSEISVLLDYPSHGIKKRVYVYHRKGN